MFKKKKGKETEVTKTFSENDLPRASASITTSYKETRTSSFSITTTSSTVKNFSSTQTYSFGGSLREKPTVRSFVNDGDWNNKLTASNNKSLDNSRFPVYSTNNNVATDAKPYIPVYPRTAFPRTATSNTSATSHSSLASPSRPPAALTTSYQRPSYSFSLSQPISAPLSSTSTSTSTDKTTVPLKIKVKKTGKRYDNTESVVPTYKTSSKKRGRVLIINNIKFVEEKELRRGAEVDEKNVKELFTQMGFEIVAKRDLKSMDLIANVTKFVRSSWKSLDICAVVIMSHGNQFNGSTNIYCTDKKFVSTEDIIEQFTSQKCIGLYNIPKIFIFQCCRGNGEDTIETDATPFRPRNYADMLIAHSTVPGYASHRDPNLGTWYIQTMCKVFCEHAHDQDVESMLKIVDHQLSTLSDSRRQTSSYENRGFKRCYLHP